ncbi:Hypothetical protein A7982_02309 [Minicystis rosea]|nr:Hypothetical protein A7982_02309 [Minicystis rosea]
MKKHAARSLAERGRTAGGRSRPIVHQASSARTAWLGRRERRGRHVTLARATHEACAAPGQCRDRPEPCAASRRPDGAVLV